MLRATFRRFSIVLSTNTISNDLPTTF